MGHSKILRWGVSVAIGVLAIVALGPQLASASGGGGCGRVVSDARGASIHIHNFCFTPTILRIRPGQTVTWVNRDPFSHTVMGANAVWGTFGELASRRSVTYRFVRAGVYPYVCTIHPGMVGAIVVGSGSGLGDARATTTESGPSAGSAGQSSAGAIRKTSRVPSARRPTSGWLPPYSSSATILAAVSCGRRPAAAQSTALTDTADHSCATVLTCLLPSSAPC